MGSPSANVRGRGRLHEVTSKVEWPEWLAPADMVERELPPAGVMKGGPGNPLGARFIGLDDGGVRIHGTNAPKTIGSSLNSGCIRLVNDDVADLYNRVALGARVVFGDLCMIRKSGIRFSKRSCSTKMLERQSIQSEAIAL